jgi:hypothetical protein
MKDMAEKSKTVAKKWDWGGQKTGNWALKKTSWQPN